MTDERHTCLDCGAEFPRIDRVTFELRGVVYSDGADDYLWFCGAHCAALHWRREEQRLRGALRRILARSGRGSVAGRIARGVLRGSPLGEIDDDGA